MHLFSTNIAYAFAKESLDQFIHNVNVYIVNPLIILLFSLAFVYFLWGIFQFLSNTDNDEQRTVGKKHMLYGIIGIVIMMGVFTILKVITNTINVDYINPQKPETINYASFPK